VQNKFYKLGILGKFGLDYMENNSQSQEKGPAIHKPFNSYIFTFLHLEIEKPPPYVGDIWVPTLPINFNRFVKIFILDMEKWFQSGNMLIKVEHSNVTS
jgi:hypothetical protein